MQTIIDLLHDPDARVRLQAATTILERAWGKPKEHLHVGGGEGSNIFIVTGVPRPEEQASSSETTYTIELDATEAETP